MFFSKAKDAVLREQEAFYDDGRGPMELGKCWEDFRVGNTADAPKNG